MENTAGKRGATTVMQSYSDGMVHASTIFHCKGYEMKFSVISLTTCGIESPMLNVDIEHGASRSGSTATVNRCIRLQALAVGEHHLAPCRATASLVEQCPSHCCWSCHGRSAPMQCPRHPQQCLSTISRAHCNVTMRRGNFSPLAPIGTPEIADVLTPRPAAHP